MFTWVYLLKMVIFHGYVSHNQRVIYITNNKQALRWFVPSCAIPRIKPHRSDHRSARPRASARSEGSRVPTEQVPMPWTGPVGPVGPVLCEKVNYPPIDIQKALEIHGVFPGNDPANACKCWVFHIFISSLGVAKIPMFCRKLHWSGQGSYTSPVVRGTVISSWCPENVRLWLLCLFFSSLTQW